MKILLEAQENILIAGYANVEVERGTIEVFGAKFIEGSSFTIDDNFAVPVECVEKAQLKITIGANGYIKEYDFKLIPNSWREIAEKISRLNKKPIKILIIGDVDSGKTGLATYLSNKLFDKGLKVYIIDTDTGQSEIGPPTTIGLGLVDRPIAKLNQAKFIDAFFIGSTTPAGVLDRMIAGTIKLLNKAALDGDAIILNTTGWVFDKGGRELKITKTIAVMPDVIILIGDAERIKHLYRAFNRLSTQILLAEKPPVIKQRSRDDRREIRKNYYKKYLLDAKTIAIPIENVSIIYSFFGTGNPLSREELDRISTFLRRTAIYGEITGESMVLILKNSEDVNREQLLALKSLYMLRDITIIPHEKVLNLIVGLYDNNMNFLGIGLLERIEFKNGPILYVWTNAPEEKIAIISFGHIRVNKDGEEIEYLRPWQL